jgi:hypothetical protein
MRDAPDVERLRTAAGALAVVAVDARRQGRRVAR